MKRILTFLLILGLMACPVYAAQWDKDSPAGTDSVSDIDAKAEDNQTSLDRMLAGYREGMKLTYASTATITVGAGEIMVSNSDGSVRLMMRNASSTTLTWADIDTGSESNSTTYYVYAVAATSSSTTATFKISTDTSAPSGETYYARLGSFYNNSSGNILNDETLTNDNDYFGKTWGDWASKSFAVSYQASDDGEVCGYLNGSSPSDGDILFYSDSASTPTTLRLGDSITRSDSVNHQVQYAGGCIPVKRGDYYKVTKSTSGTVSSGLFYIEKE